MWRNHPESRVTPDGPGNRARAAVRPVRRTRPDGDIVDHMGDFDSTTGSGPDTPATDYDVLVIGSGFGGSVTALRLTEKGYRVGVLEAGRRFADEDFAKTSWRSASSCGRRSSGCYGIQRIHLLPDAVVLRRRRRRRRLAGLRQHALRAAERRSTTTRSGRDITDWRRELAPYYDQAAADARRRRPTRRMTPADVVDEGGRRRDGRRRTRST